MLSLSAVTLVALAVGQPGETGPAAKTVRLVYVRDAGVEGCPAEPEVRAAVTGRLGYDPFRPDALSTLLARVSKSGIGFTGSIELIDGAGLSRGKREMSTEGESCDEMARAMALSMSIAVDPERAADGAAPPAAEPAAAEIPPTSEPKGAATPEEPAPGPMEPAASPRSVADEPAAPAPSSPTRLGVSVAGIGMAGVAPSLAYGGGLWLHGRRGAWSLGLGGRLLRSPSEPVAGLTELDVILATAELHGCWHRAFLEQCLVGLAGASSVSARGISQPGSDTGAFGAVGLRTGAGVSISRALELFARLEGLVIMAPVRPQVDGQDVWAAPSLAASLAAGARADFW